MSGIGGRTTQCSADPADTHFACSRERHPVHTRPMATTVPTGPFFLHPCGDGVELALRSHATTIEMHELTVANLDRLRLWE